MLAALALSSNALTLAPLAAANAVRMPAPVMQMIDDGVAARLMTRVPGFGSTGANNAVLFISMVPWSERDESTEQAARELSQMWEQVPGVRAFAFSRSGLSRGGGGQPVDAALAAIMRVLAEAGAARRVQTRGTTWPLDLSA